MTPLLARALALAVSTQYCDRHAFERFAWAHQAICRSQARVHARTSVSFDRADTWAVSALGGGSSGVA
jgi:hypothetical protein